MSVNQSNTHTRAITALKKKKLLAHFQQRFQIDSYLKAFIDKR